MGLYYIAYDLDKTASLSHYGVKGQKKGIRRWQNYDGSLTPAGRIHYGVGPARAARAETPKSAGRGVKSQEGFLRKWKDKRANQRELEKFQRLEADGRKELDSIRNMPRNTKAQRREKERRERDVLTGWDDENRTLPDYEYKLARSIAVQEKINNDGFDWYFNRGSTNEAKNLLSELRSVTDEFRYQPHGKRISVAEWNEKCEPIRSKLDALALQTIGFENTPANRELIRYYWLTD